MEFNNYAMVRVVKRTKPHIQFIAGYWRVSSIKHIPGKNQQCTLRHGWNDAHVFVNRLNGIAIRVDMDDTE